MAKSPSIRIVLTSELDDALREASQETHIPAATIAREAIADYLNRKHKVKVKEIHPGWGGSRQPDSDGE